MSEIVPSNFTMIPNEFLTDEVLDDKIFFKFIVKIMKLLSKFPKEVPIQNNRTMKYIKLQPFEFVYGRITWAKEMGVSPKVMEKFINRLVGSSWCSRSGSSSGSTYSVYKFLWRQNDMKNGQQIGQQIGQQLGHNSNTNTNTNTVSVCAKAPPVADVLQLKDHEKIEKKKFDGSSFEISKDDLFTACIQKRMDWTGEEIDELWKIIFNYQKPIRDWFALCEGTINNQRKMKAIKNLKTENIKCQKNYNAEEIKPQKKKSTNYKEETLAKDMSARPLENWRSRLEMANESSNICEIPKEC